MNARTLEQWRVQSDSDPERWYVVTETTCGEWQCGCVGWVRHYPRRDCKHIRWVKMGGAMPLDPLLRQMEVAIHKSERRTRGKVGQ